MWLTPHSHSLVRNHASPPFGSLAPWIQRQKCHLPNKIIQMTAKRGFKTFIYIQKSHIYRVLPKHWTRQMTELTISITRVYKVHVSPISSLCSRRWGGRVSTPFYPQDSESKVWIRLKETKLVDYWVIHHTDSMNSSLEESKGRKIYSCLLGQSSQWIPSGKGI